MSWGSSSTKVVQKKGEPYRFGPLKHIYSNNKKYLILPKEE